MSWKRTWPRSALSRRRSASPRPLLGISSWARSSRAALARARRSLRRLARDPSGEGCGLGRTSARGSASKRSRFPASAMARSPLTSANASLARKSWRRTLVKTESCSSSRRPVSACASEGPTRPASTASLAADESPRARARRRLTQWGLRPSSRAIVLRPSPSSWRSEATTRDSSRQDSVREGAFAARSAALASRSVLSPSTTTGT